MVKTHISITLGSGGVVRTKYREQNFKMAAMTAILDVEENEKKTPSCIFSKVCAYIFTIQGYTV